MKSNRHILVAMSGGVDSSVALYLLKQSGYSVSGVTMKLWDYGTVGGGETARSAGGCCNLQAVNNARAVCDLLGVSHYTVDFSEEFRRTVIDDFVGEYRRGRTPNPCIRCNTIIKWERLLRLAQKIGCYGLATGHYARTGFDSESGRYFIRRGVDSSRDQAYALWGLSQEALSRTVLPLGDLAKTDTRRIARQAGLKTADTAESREICFVTDDDYERFLREWVGDDIPEGEIVDTAGRRLGRHRGIPFYTVGQRKGLGIAHPTPLYVISIDAAANRLTVGNREELRRRGLTVSGVQWVSSPPVTEPFKALTQIRYQHRAAASAVTPLPDGRLSVLFDDSQAAITPGQSAVIFDGDLVMAGGVID